MRKQRKTDKRRLNNDVSLSIVKDPQLFLKSRQYSESHPVSCLTDSKTPGGVVNCTMTRLYPGHELPQF